MSGLHGKSSPRLTRAPSPSFLFVSNDTCFLHTNQCCMIPTCIIVCTNPKNIKMIRSDQVAGLSVCRSRGRNRMAVKSSYKIEAPKISIEDLCSHVSVPTLKDQCYFVLLFSRSFLVLSTSNRWLCRLAACEDFHLHISFFTNWPTANTSITNSNKPKQSHHERRRRKLRLLR